MKILFTVQHYPPDIGGMAEVARQLSTRLAKKGHSISIATSFHHQRNKLQFPHIEIFQFSPNKKIDIDRYQQLLIQSDFDVVVNFAAQQWATDLALPLLDQIKAKKILVPTGFSGLNNSKYKKYYSDLPTHLLKYDHLIFHGKKHQDFKFCQPYINNRWSLIPNGADLDEFKIDKDLSLHKKLGIPEHHRIITTIGSHNGQKGHDEAIALFQNSKIKEATLLIIGNFYKTGLAKNLFHLLFKARHCPTTCQKLCKQPLINKNLDTQIIIPALNRNETTKALLVSDLFLFLSKVECSPIVIYEAMASMTPFLSTDVGNIKEIIEWTNAGEIITSNPRDLETILSDRSRLTKLAQNGRNAIESRFNWDNITTLYEDCFQRVMNA